jgi:adenylate cyclase
MSKISFRRGISSTRRDRIASWCLGVAVVIIVASFCVVKPLYFQFFDNKLFDTFLRFSTSGTKPSPAVAIVEIDEKSLTRFGQWPWPRYRIAALLEKLKSAGAKTIALDMMFPEPDRASLVHLKEAAEKELGRKLDLSGIPMAYRDNDATLASAFARTCPILGYEFLFGATRPPNQICTISPLAVVLRERKGERRWPITRAAAVTCNIPVLASATPFSGFLNAGPDEDGVIRRMPLVIEYEHRIYPSLALAAFLHHIDTKEPIILSFMESNRLSIGRLNVPLDESGRLIVKYAGPAGLFPRASVIDVIDGRVSKDFFKDKLVFLGPSAPGLAGLKTTPLDPVFPGVEVHASVVDNLLRADFLRRPSSAPALEAMLTLVIGLLSVCLLVIARPIVSLASIAFASVLLWQACLLLFRTKGVFISPLFPTLALFSNLALLTAFLFRQEKLKLKAKTRELLETQELTIQCLSSLAETRDSDTGGHIRRTQLYVRAICERLAKHPDFSSFLTPDMIETLQKSAPLHDIGKVGVPDAILLKPGRLDQNEFDVMKKHTVYGREAIAKAEARFWEKGTSTFLDAAKDIAYYHHEKWSGGGYPMGASGKDIPISARIMAVADVYDALVSGRVYKSAYNHDEAVRIIVEEKGKYFDPRVVDAFLAVQADFRRILVKFADSDDIGDAAIQAQTRDVTTERET